ncbi:MAG: winged helix-turn-helix domain-containing protein [Gammaproteobacteria bacterium]
MKSDSNKRLFRFGPFELDIAERLLSGNGKAVALRGKGFDLLLLLLESAGHLKSRTELIERLWPDTIVVENSLSWYVAVVRKALGDEGKVPRYIETVRSHGYRFIAPIERVGPSQLPAVAVLPFESISADPENTYLTVGIHATILSKLAGIRDLRVIARTSTAQYPSHPLNLHEVAAQLSVTSVLEGSVQKAGNRVLVNMQLIDIESNDHVWAQTYTRSLDDVFEVENDIATHVAATLQAKLLPIEVSRLENVPTRDPQAYLLFIKAEHYARQITVNNNTKDPADAMTQAIAFYRQAIVRVPNFALAYARLSYLQSYAYWHEVVMTPDSLTSAEQAARQGLMLEPDLPEAQLAMGYIEYYVHRDHEAALERFKYVHRQIPSDADVIGAMAFVYSRQGKWQDSLTALAQATECDPRNPRWPYGAGFTLMVLRRYAEAEQQYDIALAIEPNNYDARAFKAMAFLFAGKPIPQVRQLLADVPHNAVQTDLIAALKFEMALLDGKPDAALAAIDETADWVSATDAVGQQPTDMLRARAWEARGNDDRAQQAYKHARSMLKNALRDRPEDASLWAFLGLTEAGYGQKQEAIRAGLKATTLLPVAKDAVSGPSYLVTLAKIYACTGQTNKALKLLRELLDFPAGGFISVPMLRRDPAWDPIRKNPDFQALLNEYANAKSLSELDVAGTLQPVE